MSILTDKPVTKHKFGLIIGQQYWYCVIFNGRKLTLRFAYLNVLSSTNILISFTIFCFIEKRDIEFLRKPVLVITR